MKHREDLRHLTVCSVDPPGCTDIDDALHCRELGNGNLEVLYQSSNLFTYFFLYFTNSAVVVNDTCKAPNLL